MAREAKEDIEIRIIKIMILTNRLSKTMKEESPSVEETKNMQRRSHKMLQRKTNK